jgi:hypothetical protein
MRAGGKENVYYGKEPLMSESYGKGGERRYELLNFMLGEDHFVHFEDQINERIEVSNYSPNEPTPCYQHREWTNKISKSDKHTVSLHWLKATVELHYEQWVKRMSMQSSAMYGY